VRLRRRRKQAQILTEPQLRELLKFAANERHPLRDKVMILLTYRAGLRASEVADLDWSNLCDAQGRLHTDYFDVIGKGDKRRQIPIHAELYQALRELSQGKKITYLETRVIRAVKGGAMTPNHIAVYLWQLYRSAGFQGASSHSGRRSMITALARSVNMYKCSLRDVQELAGHASIETTQHYIEPSKGVTKLVRNLG
jgi:integrase/recombinase XerD